MSTNRTHTPHFDLGAIAMRENTAQESLFSQNDSSASDRNLPTFEQPIVPNPIRTSVYRGALYRSSSSASIHSTYSDASDAPSISSSCASHRSRTNSISRTRAAKRFSTTRHARQTSTPYNLRTIPSNSRHGTPDPSESKLSQMLERTAVTSEEIKAESPVENPWDLENSDFTDYLTHDFHDGQVQVDSPDNVDSVTETSMRESVVQNRQESLTGNENLQGNDFAQEFPDDEKILFDIATRFEAGVRVIYAAPKTIIRDRLRAAFVQTW